MISHKTLFLLMMVLTGLISNSVFGYQPGIEELEQSIKSIELKCDKLSISDSAEAVEYQTLTDSISEMKDQIIVLKQETIDSLRRQRSLEGDNRSLIDIATFVLLLVSLVALSFLFAFRNRLKTTESVGIWRLLAGDINVQHGPKKEENPEKRRVHILVILSAAMMFGSLIMFLFRVM